MPWRERSFVGKDSAAKGEPALTAKTKAEARAEGRALRGNVPRSGFAGWDPSMRRADPIASLIATSRNRLPHLLPLRYGRMLQPHKLVGLQGAGPAYDGLHYVEKVTTSFAEGDLSQEFELTRNGVISTVPQVPV